AVGVAQPLAGLGIANDFLFGWVPVNFASCADSDIAQMADGRGTMADLDVANRQLAAFDALQPVLMMILAHVEMHVFLGERLFDQIFRGGFQIAAIDVDDSLFPFEARAHLVVLSANHGHAIGVLISDFAPLWHFIPIGLVKPSLGLNGNWTA